MSCHTSPLYYVKLLQLKQFGNPAETTFNNYVSLIINPNCFLFRADAAEVLRANRRLFEQNVQKAMRGGYVGSVYFERCLVK